jgi:succinoglycan biosynthesis protein ExoA
MTANPSNHICEETSTIHPAVSVIVPCYNEQDTVLLLLEALRAQTYPIDRIEVVIADGMSTDQTRERIAVYQQENLALQLKVVDNPDRAIPAAVNRAIDASQGEYLIRMDAHAVPAPDYVARCVAVLEAGFGDNVGGIWQIHPGAAGWVARSIAEAAAHPLGVGDARYRVGGHPQAVDTVPFGAFHRRLIERIGSFDETLLSNEDYEFNTRIRKAGGAVWFDPAIRCTYFARSSLIALAQQYWRYGYWKVRMLRQYPESIRWRQVLPPLFVLSLIGMGIVGLFIVSVRWLLLAEITLYGVILASTSFRAAWKQKDIGLFVGLPLAIATMHLSWGSAFLWSLTTSYFAAKRTQRQDPAP